MAKPKNRQFELSKAAKAKIQARRDARSGYARGAKTGQVSRASGSGKNTGLPMTKTGTKGNGSRW